MSTLGSPPRLSSEQETALRLDEKLERELGALVMAELRNPRTVEIMLNPDGVLYAERVGEGMARLGTMGASQALSMLRTVASRLGTSIGAERPVLEGELPLDGSRIEGLVPPVVRAPSFAIRKRATLVFSLADYERQGVITRAQRERLEALVAARRNVLVVGGTGTGKTTFCNALLAAIAQADPECRLALIEDTVELQCLVPNRIEMRTSEHADMTKCLRATLRLRPDRIVVGEVRGAEANVLVKAWNTGHAGGVATIHANGARAGLYRLEQLILEGGVTPSRALISEAVNVIAVLQRTREGRKLTELVEVVELAPGATDYVLEPA